MTLTESSSEEDKTPRKFSVDAQEKKENNSAHKTVLNTLAGENVIRSLVIFKRGSCVIAKRGSMTERKGAVNI